jgi:hypothetical protein
MKELCSFKTSGTSDPTLQCHIAEEDPNLQMGALLKVGKTSKQEEKDNYVII